MNAGVIATSFFVLGIGFVAQLAQQAVGSAYLNTFLSGNLINLLVALLAINSATMGIVLTKIRDLVEKHGGEEAFSETKTEMLLSIKEQIFLIALAIILLTVVNSEYLIGRMDILLFLWSSIVGVFVYSLRILYDTAKSVLIIIDFKL